MAQAGRRVLVVDDDPVILRLLQVNFEMAGFTVSTAADGVEALAAATSEPPDLVVSDVMMPGMNGLELVSALDADDRTRRIPVVLLSARAQTDDVIEGFRAGADDYVTKPFEPLDLVDRVNRLLGAP
ncbi:MAG: response regulator [Actinobacteria bacterium]|nr:response regulator [Actinomycetota bacterium]